jgi:hypothetical protein
MPKNSLGDQLQEVQELRRLITVGRDTASRRAAPDVPTPLADAGK